MDSADDIPALEPVYNDGHIGSPINAPISSLRSPLDTEHAALDLDHLSENERLPLVSTSASRIDLDDEDMPPLMAVSDSSEEQDQLDSDSNNSRWEDEDDDYSNGHGPPPFEPFPEAHPGTTSEEELEDMPRFGARSPSSNLHSDGRADTPWLSPRQSPRSEEEFPDFFANITHMRTMLDVLHLGPNHDGSVPSSQFQREILEHILVQGLAGQPDSRPSEPDPERAKVLVEGLEIVPTGLLARMVRVGGAPGAHEDLSGDDEGAMAGCAVCWAPLLDDKLEEPESTSFSFSSQFGEKSKIVSLPCAHVFHSACLLPWFSRPGTTTCPTCRFDIDPYSLTWKLHPQPRASSPMNDGSNLNGAQVPMEDWEDLTDVDGDEDMYEFLHSVFPDGGFPRPGGRFAAHRGSWTLPEAPDKTLRERIIDKERDMGLRCVDVTCVLAPTDEDPCPREMNIGQISIQTTETTKCKHTLHPACLVMSTRVAGRMPCAQEGDGLPAIEVLCPCCRMIGTVSEKEWNDGVEALALIDN